MPRNSIVSRRFEGVNRRSRFSLVPKQVEDSEDLTPYFSLYTFI